MISALPLPDLARIAAGLRFLLQIEFSEPNLSTEQSAILGVTQILTYSSSRADRSVEICYSPRRANRLAAFSVFICNGTGDRVLLEDWLEASKILEAIEFAESDAIEDEEDFITKFCFSFQNIALGPLSRTLLGLEWAIVPFSWKEYR
jgi:hypothetical protein